MLDKQVLQLIEQYVAGKIPFVDFSQRFAGLYFAVRQGRNVPGQASQLCSLAIGPLAELSRGVRDIEMAIRSFPFFVAFIRAYEIR